MKNTLYVSKDYGDSDLYLEFEVLSVHLNRWLYSVRMLQLHGSEVGLNRGRFTRFSHLPQTYQINIDMEYMNHDELQERMGNIIEWIATHSNEPWSVLPHMYHVGSGRFDFSFANATTAVTFALVWK